MRGVEATVTSCIGGKDEKFAVQVRPAAPRPQYFVYKTLGDFDALWTSLEAIAADVKRRQLELEASASVDADANADARKHKPQSVSLMAKWLANIVDHFAFRQTVRELRAQDKEAMGALNVFLHFLVPRVSGLYVESTILRCGCCRVTRQLAKLVRNFLEVEPAPGSPSEAELKLLRKRQFAEMRPEDGDLRSSATAAADGARDGADSSCKRANTGAALFPVRALGQAAPGAAAAVSVSASTGACLPPPMHKGAGPLPGRRRVFAEVDF